jgi:LytS/YehU family sensor histidine kinase
MAFAAPILCTIARNKLTPGLSQNIAVTSGFIIGFALTVVADAWTSNIIEDAFAAHSSMWQNKATLDPKNQPNPVVVLANGFVVFGIYFLIAGGVAFIRFWREPQRLAKHLASLELTSAKAEKHSAERRLSMLQAQIEPHFLFNTLASVKSVLRENPALAESTINDLVDYLRSSIPRFEGDTQIKQVSLAEQIELCGKYLKIMQLRLGERLTFDTYIDENIAERPFPPLVIISLVENAIKHGIEPKPEGGKISVTARSSQQEIVITVEDSGVGLMHKDNSLSTGVGLENIRNQLNLLYDEGASIELTDNRHGGTTATLRVRGRAL